ncbi:PIN domain-containing protein [Gaiella sp.]|uniref:PIN domain-containing protein n=1 Tax=Gaiella sp. TaxID=2663207 RepID=UPI002E31EE04|nr:PIN domain-containing protein [Gaiella sp.]HEX5583164.1 PIN domain-containing protein [Gaiella sp.]
MTWLADTSVWSWAQEGRRADVAERLANRFRQAELCTCPAVTLEAQHRARTGAEYDRYFDLFFLPLRWLPCTAATFSRALEVQRGLAHTGHGRHRRPAMDYLIAATAELAGPDVVLWAFDRDMREICEHTGQPCELETAEPQG